MSNDNKFVNGLYVDDHTFQDGGKIVKLTLTDQLVQFYEENKTVNSKGNNQMKVDVKWSKEGKVYAVLNDYKPANSSPVDNELSDDESSDLPF